MAIPTTPQPGNPGPEPSEAPPRLVDGVELIGEYEGSGLSDPPFIARRADGHVVQMKRLLYLVAEEVDGGRGYDAIAQRATERYGLKLRPEMARELVERLRALGIAAPVNGAGPQLRTIDPLLALKLRAGVVPVNVVRRLGGMLEPLFLPPVVLSVLAALVVLDVWLFGYHGIAQSVRQTLYDPTFILLMLALVVLSAAFHELGHAAACSYGGARPGTIGFGVYIVWPAFYTDVTDAYRLGRSGRLRTDLGGVYFNAIFILATAAAYLATGFEPLLLLIPLQHAEIVHQLLPFLRLDGYYIVGDLAGVPDMFSRIKPTLLSLLPWREPDPSVTQLKRWVRAVVSVYVLTVVPLLLLFLAMLVLNVPRILTTAWDSGGNEAHAIAAAAGAGDWATLVVSCIQLLVLVLIPVGLVYTLGQLALRATSGAWRVTDGRPAARAGLLAVAAGAAAFAAVAWLPQDQYRPIRVADRGTFGDAVGQLGSLPGGDADVAPPPARAPAQAPRGRDATLPPPSLAPPVTTRPEHRRPSGSRVPTPAEPAAPAPAPTTRRTGTESRPPEPAETVRTPAPSASTPAATVSTPVTTATVPATTTTAPSATVTAPSATVTAPTLPAPLPPVPTVSVPTVTAKVPTPPLPP